VELDLSQLAGILATFGCPKEKAVEMAAQLDKRARQVAARKAISYEDALAHLLSLMKQGWAAKERGL
jgi:hypothetical protein